MSDPMSTDQMALVCHEMNDQLANLHHERWFPNQTFGPTESWGFAWELEDPNNVNRFNRWTSGLVIEPTKFFNYLAGKRISIQHQEPHRKASLFAHNPAGGVYAGMVQWSTTGVNFGTSGGDPTVDHLVVCHFGAQNGHGDPEELLRWCDPAATPELETIIIESTLRNTTPRNFIGLSNVIREIVAEAIASTN